MQNMSDNELDDLFKEAADGFKPPQDASAWEQMTVKLDEATPAPGFWNWKSISAVAVSAIVVLTATWYVVNQNQESFKDEQQGNNNAATNVVQEQKEQTHETGRQNIATAEPLENKSGGNGAVISSLKNKSEIAKRSSQSGVKNGNVSTQQISGQNLISSESLSQTIEQSPEAVVSSNLNYEETVVSVNNNDKKISQEQPIVVDSALTSSQVETDSVKQNIKENSKSQKRESRSGFSIKATVSPDFSSVNFFSAGKPGINYGFLAGYSFNDRWSIYSGVISSKKLYTSDEVEGSYSSAGHDYPVKELDGDCRILDIPVNVYYSFFPQRSFSLSVGLGLSSYIMRKETYVYCVDNYGADLYYEQRIRGENNEWFKVLNVSVIASKKITNRLSAEFEPFVKAPLAGVGEGKVSLVSMGAFFNLKYDLSIRK